MKRIWTLAATALLGAALPVLAQDSGHRLTALWKEQEAASRADLPRKEAEILSRIKKEAAEKRLAADFYDAATGYVNAVQRYDWKQRSALVEALSGEVQAYGDPLVTFLWMESWTGAGADSLWRYAQAQESDMKGCRRELHRGVDALLGGSLKPFIRTDREYVLWRLVQRQGAAGNPAMEALLQEVSGVYPNEALALYFQLDATSWKAEQAEEEKAAWEALAARYGGKAVAVYPRARLLRLQLRELQAAKADGQAYRGLWEQARALEKERKASGEKTLLEGCTYPAHLMELLTEQTLWVSAGQQGEARVLLRNLPGATLTLSQEKKT